MRDHPSPSSRGSEAADAVAAVLADQKQRADRREKPPPPPKDRRAGMIAVAVVLSGLTVWVWLAPPAFLLPEPLPTPGPAQVAAGLRMDVFAAAASIRRYAEANGRLPATLAEAWPRGAAGTMTYEALPAGAFRLVGRRDGAEVRYHSSEPMADLLRAARPVLEGAPR